MDRLRAKLSLALEPRQNAVTMLKQLRKVAKLEPIQVRQDQHMPHEHLPTLIYRLIARKKQRAAQVRCAAQHTHYAA